MAQKLDLRAAINAVSDVVANRPQPIREFDQIYMKVADMVIQAHFVSQRYDGLDVVFVGDGDAIGLAVMHLAVSGVFESGPKSILILDFDERIVDSVNRFADEYLFSDRMEARLYNVCDEIPSDVFSQYDAFYTNPPWGASNNGESVSVFLERGIEALRPEGQGMIVIADDPALNWTQNVLSNSQKRAASLGFLVAEMLPRMHSYHLDDAPDLKSCVCLFRRVDESLAPPHSHELDSNRRANFYGRNSPMKVRYVRSTTGLNYGRAQDQSYKLEALE